MDADDLQNALVTLIASIRDALRTELSSIWLPIQFGAIVAAALVAVADRRDRPPAVRSWLGHDGLAGLSAARGSCADREFRRSGVHPGHRIDAHRSRLAPGPRIRAPICSTSRINLATAWVVIAILASLIRNPFINRVVAVYRLDHRGAQHSRAARRDRGSARRPRDRDRRACGSRRCWCSRPRRCCCWRCGRRSRSATSSTGGFRAVPELTPSIRPLIGTLIRITVMTVAIVVVLSSVGIDLSVLACVHRRDRRRHRFRPAEDRRQPGERNHPAGRQVDQARRHHFGRGPVRLGHQHGRALHLGRTAATGAKFLVPNEDFVTQRVINWSYSNNRMMLEANSASATTATRTVVRKVAVAAARSVGRG